jgi:hypothetical protein
MNANCKTSDRSATSNLFLSGPKGTIKNGMNINHNQTIVRTRTQIALGCLTVPKGAVKNGFNPNHNLTVAITGVRRRRA